MPTPIERYPKGALLPYGYYARSMQGRPYRPRDKPVQEDWASVAEKFKVGVQELIYFNFMTDEPDEVNWYLRHYVGCRKVSPSGNNWMFSNSASPGIIFIPPPDFSDPVPECSWLPSTLQQFMLRLIAVAQGEPGYPGLRIRKLVNLIVRVGYPAANDLWYYNPMVLRTYVDFKTNDKKRIEMTKDTGGAFAFDGDSGLYGQAGTPEHYHGQWRIHAVKDLFQAFACGYFDAEALRKTLRTIDSEMYEGWHALDLAGSGTTGAGGGDAVSRRVESFIKHVTSLSEDPEHLYSAFP